MRLSDNTNLYQICIFAHTFTAFAIQVNEPSPDIGYTVVDPGFTVSDEIDSGKKIYVYPVPKLSFSEEDIKLEFNLKKVSGHPQMFVVYCN